MTIVPLPYQRTHRHLTLRFPNGEYASVTREWGLKFLDCLIWDVSSPYHAVDLRDKHRQSA